MNSISAPRDDHGLIGHQAQRARAGLIPKTRAVRRYPAPNANSRPEPRPSPWTAMRGTAAPRAIAAPVWRGPERRKRCMPVLLDTRARPERSLDLTA